MQVTGVQTCALPICAQVGSENDADAGDQGEQAGAQERYRDDRYQGAGLHDRGADDAETETLRNRICCSAQHILQESAGELAEPVLDREHAKQEDRNPGGNLFELGARPERKSQKAEYSGEDELAVVHWLTFPAVGAGLIPCSQGAKPLVWQDVYDVFYFVTFL